MSRNRKNSFREIEESTAPVDEIQSAPAVEEVAPPVEPMEVRPSKSKSIPSDAMSSREYPDRIVYVDRNGRKHTIAK